MKQNKLSNTIWMYWHQGFDQAPELVKQCVKSWLKFHPNWKIHLLDSNSINSYIEPIPLSKKKMAKLSLAHRSDLIRTQLLIQHGGVWVDPTCFCIYPLDNWLFKNFKSGLFLFYKPGRDRIISNWFIAAEKENYVLKILLSELCEYWENNTFRNLGKQKIWYEPLIKRIYNRYLWSTNLWFTWFAQKVLKLHPYMVYHYKFYELISKNFQCKLQWDEMPKISADNPHMLQKIGLLNSITCETKDLIDKKSIPIFKLTWKIEKATWSKESVLAYLFNH